MSSNIHPTAILAPGAKSGERCAIGPYCCIGDHVCLGDDTEVGAFVIIDGWTEIGSGCQISSHAVLGTPPQHLKHKGDKTHLKIGDETIIREFVTVNRGTTDEGGGTVIGERNYIMAYAHIAHDCVLGNQVVMANGASLAGHVLLEDYVNLGALAGIHQFVRIGCYAMVGAFSGLGQDVPPYMMVSGIRARPYGINVVGLKRYDFPPGTVKALKGAFHLLFQSNLNTSQALERVKAEIDPIPEIQHLVEFIRTSKRGITK